MFGKVFALMYTGSMYGQPPEVFAIWGWMLAHLEFPKGGECYAEINPAMVAPIFQMKPQAVMDVLEFLEAPDEETRTEKDGGRRIVLEGKRKLGGPMLYRVVNGQKYRDIRDADKRRESNRKSMAKARAKQKAGEEWDETKWEPEGKDSGLATAQPLERDPFSVVGNGG